MTQYLGAMGLTVAPFGQYFKGISPPTKELMKLVLEGRLTYDWHPVLRWMMDHIFIRQELAGNSNATKANPPRNSMLPSPPSCT